MIETYVDESAAQRLWDLFTSIAVLPYESSESTGTLLLAPDRSGVELVLVLNLPLTVAEVRGVRKLLQISSENLSLLCDGAEIYGLGRSRGPDRLPLVEFQFHGRWCLSDGEHRRLEVDMTGAPKADEWLSESVFIQSLLDAFGPMRPDAVERLWQLMVAASGQPKGTTVLITPYAVTEVVRLGSQCTAIGPLTLTPALVERITGIDGTVIIDLDGVCQL